jgi:hypothetical protein
MFAVPWFSTSTVHHGSGGTSNTATLFSTMDLPSDESSLDYEAEQLPYSTNIAYIAMNKSDTYVALLFIG